MIKDHEMHRAEIERLCNRFHLKRLDVFGSAVDGTFDPNTSDFDFLAEFEPHEPGAVADAYFGLAEELRKLLGRRIDLLTPKAIRNPYMQRAIDKTKHTLYAA